MFRRYQPFQLLRVNVQSVIKFRKFNAFVNDSTAANVLIFLVCELQIIQNTHRIGLEWGVQWNTVHDF